MCRLIATSPGGLLEKKKNYLPSPKIKQTKLGGRCVLRERERKSISAFSGKVTHILDSELSIQTQHFFLVILFLLREAPRWLYDRARNSFLLLQLLKPAPTIPTTPSLLPYRVRPQKCTRPHPHSSPTPFDLCLFPHKSLSWKEKRIYPMFLYGTRLKAQSVPFFEVWPSSAEYFCAKLPSVLVATFSSSLPIV